MKIEPIMLPFNRPRSQTLIPALVLTQPRVAFRIAENPVRWPPAAAPRRPLWLLLNIALLQFTSLCCAMATGFVWADEAVNPGFESPQALLERFCVSCHSGDQPAASLNLAVDVSDQSIVQNHGTWSLVLDRLTKGDMPPADAPERLPDASRVRLSTWLDELFKAEANRHSDDPADVPPRRLSNAEFDNCVRDLTGVDIRPTKEFPVDPANEAGFDNSAESLSMTPALLVKYVSTTRSVADHAVFTPRGLVFAPFPCVAETDRDKFCVQRIVDFYHRHEVRYEDYLLTLWRFEREPPENQTSQRLKELAGEQGLSVRYLRILQDSLQRERPIGPFAELRKAWRDEILSSTDPEKAKSAALNMAKLIRVIRDDLTDPIPLLKVNGISQGSQPLIIWWNEQQAKARLTFPGDGEDPVLDQARREFCEVFPNSFFVASRGHYSNADLGANVRLLSAGFHLMQGYFRDDQPLRDLVLTPSQTAELDQLWEDLEFVTDAPIRQYKDFLFFERAEPPQFAAGEEFDFARPENKDVTSEASLKRMSELYRQAAQRKNASETALNAIDHYFETIQQRIRWIEATRLSSQEAHLQDLKRFAAKAWRSPLTTSDNKEIDDFYLRLRTADGLSHEDAMRDSIASILLSPRFCFRTDAAAIELGSAKIEPDAESSDESHSTPTRPLSDLELASRLSFFLWASCPDDELLTVATQNRLSDPAVLNAQLDRMLNDPKAMGLAREFLANWLEFRRFEEHNAVDRNRYPSFDDELRSAMFEEPLRFFVDLIQRNGTVHELIASDHTFVNRVLAQHYGVSHADLQQGDDVRKRDNAITWRRIDGANSFGRGGLLPMSVFLTKNSPGLRTSPVKRGYWVVRRLLGERIPAPPPNIPELPKDEAHFGKRSLAEMLAQHRENTACAVCHDRFDSVGLIFESYGPIGDRRDMDLAGNPVETEAVFPDGTRGRTLDDLKHYLTSSRSEDFERNFVKKLLSYGLGRSLKLSDAVTIDAVHAAMKAESGSVRSAIRAVVRSPQFRLKRTAANASDE